MIDLLIELDKEFFLFLNKYHTDWLDPFMVWASETIFWLPLYGLLSLLIIKQHKKDTWIILLAIGFSILLADQIASTIMKPFFMRLRPSRDPALDGLVHIVNGYKGHKYGFVSSHAANTFATALFVWYLLKENYKWISLIFLWAIFVMYTRIYLGVHYPGDILGGILVGWICGWSCYKLAQFILLKKNKPDAINTSG